MKPVLLDTCALIWLANRDPISAQATRCLREAAASVGILASPISAWEIGLLASRRRLTLKLDPSRWFERALHAGVGLAQMPPDVLVASSYLPPSQLRDPADRIFAATARAYGYAVMRRDGPLAFGAAGHIDAVAC